MRPESIGKVEWEKSSAEKRSKQFRSKWQRRRKGGLKKSAFWGRNKSERLKWRKRLQGWTRGWNAANVRVNGGRLVDRREKGVNDHWRGKMQRKENAEFDLVPEAGGGGILPGKEKVSNQGGSWPGNGV